MAKKTAISGQELPARTYSKKEVEEPTPFLQQFSAAREATKEFLELLLRIGLAKEERDAE
jgi:hypothetical protein